MKYLKIIYCNETLTDYIRKILLSGYKQLRTPVLQITTLHKYISALQVTQSGCHEMAGKFDKRAYDRRALWLRTGRSAKRFFFSVPALAHGTRCLCLFYFFLFRVREPIRRNT